MAEADVRVLISNTGDALPNGESANKIRDNLQKAFSQSPVNVKVQASTASVRGIRDSIIAGLRDIKIDVGANVKFTGINSGAGGVGGRAGQRSALGVGIDYSAADAAKNEAEKLNAIRVAHDEWSKKIIATVGRTNTKLKAEAERIPDAVIREDTVKEIDARTNSVIAIVQRLAKSTDKLVPSDLGPLDEAVSFLNRATSEANALYSAVEKLQNKIFASAPTNGANDDWLNSATRELAKTRGAALDKATRFDDRGLMYGSMVAVEDYAIEAEQFLAQIASQSNAITDNQKGQWKTIVSMVRGAADEYVRDEKKKQAELVKTAKAQEEAASPNGTSTKLRRAAQERMYKNIDMAVNGDKDSKEILAEMRQFYELQEREAERANDVLLAIDEKRIASGRRRRAEELRAEEAQAQAINKAQEQNWRENERYSKDLVKRLNKTDVSGTYRNSHDTQSTYAQLIQEAEAYAQRVDEISQTERDAFEQRISMMEETVKRNKQWTAEDKKASDERIKAQEKILKENAEYVAKQSGELDSVYSGMQVRAEYIHNDDLRAELLQALDDAWDDAANAMDGYDQQLTELTPQQKKFVEDAIKRLKDLVDQYEMLEKLIRDVDKDAQNAQKKADSNLASNQDFVSSTRQDYKREMDFWAGHTEVDEYAKAKSLLQDIDALLVECGKDTEKWQNSDKKEVRDLLRDLRELRTEAETSIKATTITAESEAQAKLGAAQFEQYLRTLSPKAFKEAAAEIEKIRTLFGQKTPAAIKEANAALKDFKANMKNLGYEGGNILTYIGEKIKTFATYLVSSTMTTNFTGTIAKIITNVKDLDSALVDLRIVTGDTKEETRELLFTYNDMAKQLGTTTTAVAEGATDWLRQGYDAAESAELLKQSMTLSIVGAMESEDATNALTAALKGYSLAVDDASSVVDKFFRIDMSAATSSSDLALALAKTAANAKLAGLSLDDVIAQLAVVNETMKESGEETGSFYNTMLSRMGNIKAGRVNDMESGDDLSDVESTLRNMDIMLRDSSGQFRNFGEVLDEVGRKWDSFSNIQQRAIATAFAGRVCA